MVALAGIGDFAPDTVRDRGIVITMQRRAPDERVDSFRRRDAPALEALRDRVHDWVVSQHDALAGAAPHMPVEDRAADTWEPLIRVADLAGGEWPARARAACLALTDAANAADTELSVTLRLLQDIYNIFAGGELPFRSSERLVAELRGIPDAPWGDWNLTASSLARRLSKHGIKPGRLPVVDGHQLRGYREHDFEKAWQRYLPEVAAELSGGVTPSSLEVNSLTASNEMTPQTVTHARTVTDLTSADDGMTAKTVNSPLGECHGCGRALLQHETMEDPAFCDACRPEEDG